MYPASAVRAGLTTRRRPGQRAARHLPSYAQDLVKGAVLAAALIVTFATTSGRRG